jgi:lipopolysaccharide transport system ATP-binding protein
MKPRVEVESLSKLYRLGSIGATTVRDTLERITSRFRRSTGTQQKKTPTAPPGRQGPQPDTFWAIRDISFSAKAGEIIGIVGRNGAGKSTLLKILSRITEPTSGRAILRGRLASLLEVGTGFHPDLTGRENVFLNGTILGMKRWEISAKFDEIVAFAEIEQFIDTPVKHYSSGMFVRLAFAVAAHLEPEILFIDEVLAVGDAGFQKKCLGKMGEVASQQGRTVFFVSHNMGAVRSLCDEAILIHDGRLTRQGKPDEIIREYLSVTTPSETTGLSDVSWKAGDAPGNDEIALERVRLVGNDGDTLDVFAADEPIGIEIHYHVKRRIQGNRFHMVLRTQEGELAFAATDHLYQPESQLPGHYRTKCTIPARLLNLRTYVMAVGCGIPGVRWLIPERECLSFTVSGIGNQASHYPENWPGVVCPAIDWKVESLEPSAAISS